MDKQAIECLSLSRCLVATICMPRRATEVTTLLKSRALEGKPTRQQWYTSGCPPRLPRLTQLLLHRFARSEMTKQSTVTFETPGTQCPSVHRYRRSLEVFGGSH